jgi:hypothetical protein
VRIAIVPSTLALLPEYASIDDPVADLRAAVNSAVAWLVEDGPASVVAATPSAERVGAHLLGDRLDAGAHQRLLAVANGSATRTEKAPGFLDERAAGFDLAVGAALSAGHPAALGDLDLGLAQELWCRDAPALVRLATTTGPVEATVDYDDDPFGVQYWVVRWQCGS